jgi:RNA-directed DNA polymerase
MNTVSDGGQPWFRIAWYECHDELEQMQMDIAAAWNCDDMEMVAAKQMKLVNSFAAKAIAVKIVTTNKGKQTPGIDGIVWDSPLLKWKAVKQ